MVDFGCCVKCSDNCIVTNEIIKDGEKENITMCVKPCSVVVILVCCESCLETFNKGIKNKIGQILT